MRVPLSGPTMLILVTVAAIAAVVWGNLNPSGITVQEFDAGPVSDLAIAKVVAFEEMDIFLVGLADARIRVIDGVLRGSGCIVDYRPDDDRGRAQNPGNVPGTFVDPCSGAVWAITGDAISDSTEALRTFFKELRTLEDGRQHVLVELIGRPLAGSDP